MWTIKVAFPPCLSNTESTSVKGGDVTHHLLALPQCDFVYQQIQPPGDRKPQPERGPEVTETGGFRVFKAQKSFLKRKI